MKAQKLVLDSLEDTQKFACQLSEAIAASKLPLSLGLQGPLGAGKTTLCRELLSQLGYKGKVKSPSYSLIESYQTNQLLVHHIDAYRLKSGEESELGLESFLAEKALVLIEWVEKLGLQLDLYINFHTDSSLDSHRTLQLEGKTPRGKKLIARLLIQKDKLTSASPLMTVKS